MLFTARPPLPYLKPPIKPRCRNLDPIVQGVHDYLDRFEEDTDTFDYKEPISESNKKKEILI